MNHRVALRQTARALGIAAFVAIAGIASATAAPSVVPSEYQGTWVPSKSACDSPVRVQITGDRLTLANGSDSESIGGIEMAGPGYFPPNYNGIMAVLLTEFEGDQPAMATFNLNEKKGVAQVEFSPVVPGKATPQSAKYNAHISELNLAKRFPLNKVLLKHCAKK